MNKGEFEQKLSALIEEGLKTNTTIYDVISALEFEKIAMIILVTVLAEKTGIDINMRNIP